MKRVGYIYLLYI